MCVCVRACDETILSSFFSKDKLVRHYKNIFICLKCLYSVFECECKSIERLKWKCFENGFWNVYVIAVWNWWKEIWFVFSVIVVVVTVVAHFILASSVRIIQIYHNICTIMLQSLSKKDNIHTHIHAIFIKYKHIHEIGVVLLSLHISEYAKHTMRFLRVLYFIF